MTDYEQDVDVLVFICEKKWRTTQFSTEALIGLVKVYNHRFLYRIVVD